VYFSSNGGANWNNVSTGLLNLDDRALTVSNSNLYVAAVGGVWKRPLSEIVGVQQITNSVPDKFSLEQNYPNPFNPTTKIRFSLPVSSDAPVKLVIFDALGKEVETLVNENLKAGIYEVDFDGSIFASGVYYYKLNAGNFAETRKMILIK
jgi:hypothetical protein